MNRKITPRALAEISVAAALLAVCSWLTVPTAVPFTMQTFGVYFALLALGGGKGSLAVLVYLALGTLGVPVFSGFSGGIGHLLGPTGGYLFGFLFTCLPYLLAERANLLTSAKRKALVLAVGTLGCYAVGTVWFAVTYGSYSFWQILLLCVIPYVIPDGLKLLLALSVERKMPHF